MWIFQRLCTTIPLSSLKISYLYTIPCGFYESPNEHNRMCELCMFSQIRSQMWYCTSSVSRYTHWYQCIYLVRTFHKSFKLFDGKMKLLHSIYSHHQLYINCGFNLKLTFILMTYWSLLLVIKNSSRQLKDIRKEFGWVFNTLYSILYKEH